MRSLSIFATSSDAGKSTLSFALTYLLKQYGINVAPFKAQNVSNTDVQTYYRDLDTLKPIVKKAFKTLNKEYECKGCQGMILIVTKHWQLQVSHTM